ncbi:MAG: DUF3226 domain-containing protein [Fusobacteriaceae bacterium]
MKLIITEGAGEIGFLYYLLKHIGCSLKVEEKKLYKFENSKKYTENEIVENINILNLGGHGNLNMVVSVLMKDANFKNIKSVSFLIDAENNYDETVAKYSRKLKDMNESEESNIQHTSLFVSPDGKSKGMLEDLVLKTLKYQEMKTHIEGETIPQLEIVKKEKIKNKSKATLMIYSASQNSLDGIKKFIKEIIDFEPVNCESV